ncbi:MAG TPA: hypothetical protein VJH88_04460 [Candidatus Nanoarchaeia archaeon]|nr:hypothetical protein [Candidatus Nanoarchaeia archaeon]
MEGVYIHGKPVFVTSHAIKQARAREIAYPDHVYTTLKTGKIERFAKHGLKIIGKSKNGSIICIGEDFGHAIIIKTIERGN